MRGTSCISLGIALCLLQGGPVEASDSSGESVGAYDLDEIIVTASRRSEKAFVVPYTVNVQDARELIENRQVRTLVDAMRELPGVMVQKTGHGQGSPYVRGFTGLRTLFLIDGIRLNNSTFREGPNQYWNTVDPFSVQRLELVKGPSSVLHGSDAIGGTVNAISRNYDDLDGKETRGRIVVRGASAEESFVARPEVGYKSGNLKLLAGFSYKDFGDLHAGGGTGDQPRTGYDERDADIKITYDISAKRRLTAAVQRVTQDDAWRVHKTVFAKSWRGTTTGNELRRSLDQRRTLAYLQYEARDMNALASNMTLSLSWHQQDEERLRVRNDGRIDRQGTKVGTLGLWGQLDIPARRGPWTTGVEVYRDNVDSFRKDFNADGTLRRSGIQGPVADDASYVIADAFVQKQTAIGDNGELVAGVRYTWSQADANSVQNPTTGGRMAVKDSWNNVVGSLRYSHDIGAGRPSHVAGASVGAASRRDTAIRLFVGLSQGFRAPNLSDLTRFDSARTNEIETPAIGLDPERFLTFEIGTKFESVDWSGQVSIYRTSINDMIVRTPTGRIIDGDEEITKKNSGRGFVNGIELQARYRLTDAWSVFGNLAWVDGEVDTFPDSNPVSVREPLDRLMPFQAYLGGRWQPAAASYWLEALLSMADKQGKLSTRDRADTDRIPPNGTPGYAVLTLRGGWGVTKDWRVSVAAENIFDENYRVHGSGLNEPGRSLVVSVIRTFL
ncbi:MAG: TonB-dependent receptor [Desulfobulbaceae bacterium]|nr:TonB-dependent receptor [Desulfobulbaceae bacterium]